MNPKQIFILIFCIAAFSVSRLAEGANVTIQSSVLLIDGTSAPCNVVQPGDTVFLLGGPKDYMIIRNFTGSFQSPIIIINKIGKVIINTNHNYGIDIKNCKYIRFTGSGDPLYYFGISIERVGAGAGLSMGYMSSDCEMDHIYINSTTITGIFAKTDPDCDFLSTRDKFTQYNTVIHDCYISNTTVEGMYVGSSFYSGKTLTCNGKDTTVLPSLLNGVRIYNNIVKYTGWDGIQVGSASTNCSIYNNLVMYDSQEGANYQMSGILIGGGSRCDCYNNYIYKGKGDGIESLGLGNYKIFNNVIVNAGVTYQPGVPSAQKYGIYVNDNSAVAGSSFTILFNDIINPKTNGIKFMSNVTTGNLIASNAIINPGAGTSGYVVVANSGNVQVTNNYQSMAASSAGFMDTTYRITAASPLKDAGYSDNKGIFFDYFNHARPIGTTPDIGINEYNSSYTMNVDPVGLGTVTANTGKTLTIEMVPFPNPVVTTLTIRYKNTLTSGIQVDIYNTDGVRLSTNTQNAVAPGIHSVDINVASLPEGICMFTVRGSKDSCSGRFFKMNQ